MSDPAPVPRRVALLACAHVLSGRALRLRGMDRRDRSHAARLSQAAELDGAAYRLIGLAGDRDFCAGEGTDAAVLGYLAAALADHGEARAELRAELVAIRGRDVLATWDGKDLAELVRLAVAG